MDFTDRNIPSVFTERITVGKKIIKTKQKNNDVSFLPEKISSVNPLVNCEHYSSY
jgi:chorismate mutase